jgi:hypothetical protein
MKLVLILLLSIGTALAQAGSPKPNETYFRDVRKVYGLDTRVFIKGSPVNFGYNWILAKGDKKGRYIGIPDSYRKKLDPKYIGAEATVVAVQLEENLGSLSHRLGPSDDDVLEPYFSLVVRFDDGTLAMRTDYLISLNQEAIPAQIVNARAEAIQVQGAAVVGKNVYATALSHIYYPDLSVAQAMTVAGGFSLDGIDELRGVPLLQPLLVTSAAYLRQAGALLVSLRLPDVRVGIFVATCDTAVTRRAGSCFETLDCPEHNCLWSEIPSLLTPSEIEAIQKRSLFTGMSDRALYLSLGYPDKSNDYGRGGKQLVYHGGSLLIYLDSNDKVADTQAFEH